MNIISLILAIAKKLDTWSSHCQNKFRTINGTEKAYLLMLINVVISLKIPESFHGISSDI